MKVTICETSRVRCHYRIKQPLGYKYNPTSIYVAPFSISRLRFIKFSKPDADRDSLSRGLTSSYPWGIPKGSSLNPTRTSRSIAPSGISSAPSRAESRRGVAHVVQHLYFAVPFPVVFGRFHWNSARVSYVALVDRRFFDHEAPRYIPWNKWPRRSLRRTGWMPKCNKRIVVRIAQTDSLHIGTRQLSELSFSIARSSNVIVVERALVIPQIRASSGNRLRDQVKIEGYVFCLRPGFLSKLRSYALIEFNTSLRKAFDK